MEGLPDSSSDAMDKKNVDTSLETPSFFEIFKAQCSESDLGPISFNWFEELSSEAPLYYFENPEVPEHTTSCVDQSTFKTPKGKLPINTQLASTPMIFKEQNKTLPLFVSPVKEVGQSKGEAGRCPHPLGSVDTALDQSDEVVSPPFNTCLLASPPSLRKTFKTPPSNKCVLTESLLRTPKLFEAQTQKCISESLGAEMDPDMSWSSSLATPPTLSPTVIIARGNDTVSGTKPHDERITLIMHSLFSKYHRSPTKNTLQSTSGIEDLHTNLDSENPNFEKPIDGSFGVRFPSKSSVNQKPPEDEDMHDTGTDSGISVCPTSGKAFLRKVKTVKPSQKTFFEVEYNELKENNEMIKDSEEFSIIENERELNKCKCSLQRADCAIHNNRMQTCLENQNGVHIEKEMPSSLLSPWSQLDLSGLEITQLEKVSSCYSGSSSTSHVEKSSENRASANDKVCATTSTLESCTINTSGLKKTDKLFNNISLEKLAASENSPIPAAIIRKKSSTPVKVCNDEHATVENVSDSGSFLIENTTFTEVSEARSNCFHKYSKENCKISSGPPIDNISTPVASDDGNLARSGLPTGNLLSNLKRRPKKFIYTVNNTPLHRKEGTTERDGPSAFHVSSCTDFKFCIAEVPKTASRNEGQTEETLSSNKHIIEEKLEVGSEESCTFPDSFQETVYNNKSSTESHVNDLSVFLQTENKEEAVLLSTQGFDGFKTASNKEIAVSNNSIRKGKLLFTDTEDQFLEDLSSKRMKNISNQNAQENAENSSVVRNNLNIKKSSNFSHVSDFQVNFRQCSDTRSIFPEYANLFFQNVCKNLTASQEAEVTELSNILEETGSQFESTQFNKQRAMLYNNNWEVPGSIDKHEVSKLGRNSEVWKDGDFDECTRTKVQGNYLSPSKCINTTEESKAERQSREDVTSVNSLTGKWDKAHFATRPPFYLSDLEDCSSIVNTQVNVSEIISKAPKAVSEMGEMLDYHKTCFQSGLSERSNNYLWNNPKCMKEIDWHQRVREVNAEYMLKNNANDIVTFVKENKSKDTNFNENNVVHISSTTEVNLKIVHKYSIHMTGNQLSSIENNRSILVSRHFINCGETQCKYNLQETLSDLTCLAEVTKTEKSSTLNDADEKENLNSNKDQEKINNSDSTYSLQSVHSGADGSILAEKSKTFHLLAGSCVRKELGNMSSPSSEKAGRKGAITSVEKSIDLIQNEINYQEGAEIQKRKQNSAMGFYTASGKQVTVSDESLAKARHLLSEQNLFPKKEDTFRNLVKPGIRASAKENKDEKLTKVRKELGEGTERHWRKVINPQSDFEDSLQTVNPETMKDLSVETNAFESVLLSHSGRGKEYTTNEGLLAKKNRTHNSSKNDISKMVFIDSDMEQHFYVEGPSISEKQDVHNLSIRNTSSVSHDACNERNSLSDNLMYISQEASSKRFNAEKTSCNFEDVSKNESCALQKCDLKFLDANALPKNSPGQTAASTSKVLKSRPLAFTTASGKSVGVSQDALTKTRQLLRSNCCKPIEQNREMRKHDVLKSCSDIVGSGNCTVSANCLSVENVAVKNFVASQFPRTKEYCCRDKQTLQHSGPVSLDLGPESSSQTSCFQMKAEHSNACISNKLSGINADFSTDNCGFFSTASGKPIQLSEESLKKSKLLFSEIENNSPDYQGTVSDCNYGYDGSSLRNKATPQKNKLQLSHQKKPPDVEVNSNIPCGFSTASGKQMPISDKALQKVMGLINEFDVSSNCSVDKQSLRQGIKLTTETEDEIMSKSKLKKKCDAVCLTSNRNEKDLVSIKVPMCVSRTEKDKQAAELENCLPSAKEMEPLETNQLSRIEIKCTTKSNAITKGNLNFHCPAYSQIRDNYLETEASESTKAFMEDDDLTDTQVQKNKKKSSLVSGETSNFRANIRTGKRQMEEENTFGRCLLGEPPIKRKLLPEFDQSERPNNSSFNVLKSSPDGAMNDRRKFTYNISLKPVICDPFRKSLTEESKKKENYHTAKTPVKVFVPPFKAKSGVSEDKISNSKESDLFASKSIDGKEELNPAKFSTTTTELENDLFEQDTATQISRMDLECRDADLTEIIANLHHARNLQEIRILKKQRQRVCPQPGSLYLIKTSAAACRVPLKAAVELKSPGSYSSDQLYSFGVSKQCMKVNSRNAEDFQFLIQEFFSREYFLERHGILLADGGYLIPTNEGKAGKEEFYQALCDTPGVDPKLISKAWVYNHYRWIVWKLAAMEVAFPQEFANKCLTPERVLLQLKYRYDVEIDRSSRSAIKRITERDDIPAKTLILCISKIISLSANMSHICGNKNIVEESKKKVAAVEVTDGWYGIRAVLDPPLQSLLCKDKLAVGQKIIVHGAELVGSQDASTPLEAPESLVLKISANSTRRTRWYSKLGYHWDPRPFCVPLSSLFRDGGTVSCIDVIVQRAYPIQWMEKVSVGSYVFRNSRAEEREAARHAENRQKMLEALLEKIQAEFEKSEGEGKRTVRSRTLTRQQIRSLQDGAELYEAVLNAADPAYMEGYFSKEQLKALNSHRQVINEKRQAQIEAEFRKAVESAEQDEHTSCKRDVVPVMKLRIMDYRKEGRCKEVILNIWCPSSDVCTLLKEGGRYRIFQLTASQSKDRSETANLQLTATKKTQYLQLPVSQEILAHVYKPRQPLQFSKLLDPSFRPTFSEVDLVGYIVCLRKGTGFSTLLYLSDENHNLIAVQICSDLKQLAIEDIVVPSTLISATNLQWRPEFRSCIPTLFAGDRSAFSSNPKENHLQGVFNELRNMVANNSCFGKDVQQRLMDLLQANGPQVFNSPKECGLDPFPSPWKPGAVNKHLISTCSSELKHPSPMTLGKLDPKPLVLLSSTKRIQETPKDYKKRKAIDLLNQVPSSPPVKPICTLVSPLLKRAFQPPRSSGAQRERSLERRDCQSVKKPALKRASEAGFPFENNFVADEELAMINTQALLTNFSEDKEGGSTDEMAYAVHSDLPARLLLRNNSSQSAGRKNIMQDNSVGADAPKKDTDEINSNLAVQKKLQRQRKPK